MNQIDGTPTVATNNSDNQKPVQNQESDELRRLKTEHQLILDAAGEGIYGLDCEGRTTFVNSAATELLGWREEEVLGEVLHDIHHHSHPDGTPYPRAECPIYAAMKDGEIHRVDNEVFWTADGRAIPVEYTSTPIWHENQLKGAVVVFRDISQRREFELQRQEAFDEIVQLKEQLELERDYLRDEISVTIHYGEIIGDSQALKRTLAQIEAVAKTTASVLILGESGVGKEMIAHAIHSNSDRADKPLVKVNCASIPNELFESEFFGHVKGAFTGAHRDRVGRLQLADGGTLFLDEVGEIPLALQGKLLRALQEQEFERVGDEKTTKVEVRVVAATNKNLLHEVKEGNFREDLYYRLSVFPIEVPPLRERVSDIAPLAQQFLDSICTQQGRERMSLSKAQAASLSRADWPGNIRELKNVIERAVILSPGDRLRLDLAMPGSQADDAKNVESTSVALDIESGELMTEAEFRALEKTNLTIALNKTKWRISGAGGAADLLGLKPSTLSYRMKVLGIEKQT